MSMGLILVGHGSSRYPDSAQSMLDLAEHLRGRGPWGRVSAGFMKQDPQIQDVVADHDEDILVVIPVFAGQGYYTDRLVPTRLGLDGVLTRRNGRTILYGTPVGADPRLPGIMACRADGVGRQAGWDPKECSVLLIAHGSARPGGAGETPRAIAAAMAAMTYFAEVQLAFLEQAPYASDWAQQVRGDRIIAMPLLIAQGTHASQDIPSLFQQVGDRQVVLANGLGAEPDLVSVIAHMALTLVDDLAAGDR